MSIFVQEVLGLLKRNFVKTTLNPTDDYFQFVRKGPLSRARASAGGFAPQGQALSISAGSWLCSQTGPNGLGRFARVQKNSGEVSYVPVFTFPEGQCSWNTLKDSVIRQDTGSPMVYIGDPDKPASLTVYEKVFIPKLNPNNAFPNFRGQIVYADKNGELKTSPGLASNAPSFLFDPTNGFNTRQVNNQFGAVMSQGVPVSFTRISNKTVLQGPIYDATPNQTGFPQAGQILIARQDPNPLAPVGDSDGRVLWGDAPIPDLQFGEIIIGYKNPQPVAGSIVPAVASFSTPLGTGNNNEVLTSGGPTGFPSWAPNPGISGSGTNLRIAMFTPNSNTISNSLMIQDGNAFTPATTVTNDGKWINTGTMKLKEVAQEASDFTERILCIFNDPNNANNPNNGLIKFRPKNSVGVQGTATLRRVPLWSPDGLNIESSLLIQSDKIQPPANYPVVDPSFVEQKLTNDGSLQQTKELYLDTVTQDDTLAEVLVRDPNSANEVKFRNVATISPAVGFDTLTMSTTANWTQTFLNAYISLDDTTVPYRNIQGMTTLTDGQTGVVIAENIKQGTLLADDVIRFPVGWGTTGNLYDNRISWAAGFDNGYPTSTLLYGESLKFKYHNYEIAGGGFAYKYVMYWESCCKLFSLNTCPTVQGASYDMIEDSSGISHTLIAVDDGYGGYTPVYTISALNNPAAGTLTLTNSSTGAFTFVPAANFNGSTFFTFTYNDGYCESASATITLNVLPVNDKPIWTSDDPVTLNTYPNLIGGDAWTYTWTTADPDTPCASLIYTITVNAFDGNGPITIFTTGGGQTGLTWLTFTPDPNNNCTGTLSGTYPPAAGNFEVLMEVSDGTANDTQTFTIGGLTVSKNTYFVFCSDSSGSMRETIRATAEMSSVPKAVCKTLSTSVGSPDLFLTSGTAAGSVDDPSGNTDDSFFCIVPGMQVSGNGIPAGTTVVSLGTFAAGDYDVELSNNPTSAAGDIITFTLTQAQKTADYGSANNFRNLLQDFYATGGTASGAGNPGNVPNTNPVTNGQNDYDDHLYWYHNGEERPLGYLGFQKQQAQGINVATIGATGFFPLASNIVVMAWADESAGAGTYQASPGEIGSTSWNNRNVAFPTATVAGTNPQITGDVTAVQDFIEDLEIASGNNTIYRGIAFRVNNTTVAPNNGQDLEEIMGPNGFAQTGGRTGNGYSSSFAPDATAYTVSTQSLYDVSNSAPAKITYVGNVTEASTETYYYNLVRAQLNAIGFNL